MKRILKLAVLGITGAIALAAQIRAANLSDFVVYNYDSGTTIPGLLYNPAPPAGQRYPLVIFYHGAGETGLNQQINGNIDHLLSAAKGITQAQKFFLLAPQSTSGSWGGGPDKINKTMAMVAGLIRDYPIDPTKIYVTGLSAGGEGTWVAMAYYHNSVLAAGVPLSADADLSATIPTAGASFLPGTPAALIGVPIWAYHSRDDTNGGTPISLARHNVDLIRAADSRAALTWPLTSTEEGYVTPGSPWYNDAALYNSGFPGNPAIASTLYDFHGLRYSELNRGGHSTGSWNLAYDELAMYSWLFSKSSSLQFPQTGDVFLFDFGGTVTTPATDFSGRSWNSVTTTPNTGNMTLAPNIYFAKNSAGIARTVSLTITKPFNWTFTGATTSSTTYPATATQEGWGGGQFSNGGDSNNNVGRANPGEVLIGGLTPGANYKVICYGACNLGHFGNTDYTVTGASSQTQSLTTSGNVNGTSVFASVTADSKGNIKVSVIPSAGGPTAQFGAINALEIQPLVVGGTPPSITGTPTSPATVGTPYSFTFGKAGSPTPTFAVTLGSLPPGILLNTGTGVLSGTPTGTGGSYAATVTVSNGVTPPASTSFTINVNAAPAFTNALAPSSGVVGTAYNGGSAFTFTTSGTPKPSLTYSGTLPAGMTFTPGTGGSLGTATLSGTPTATGTFSGTVTASNGIGTNATQPVSITVSSGVTIPTISGTPPLTGTTGTMYTYSFTVTGTPTSYGSSGLPPGLNFTSGVLSGTPTAAGSYNVSLTATNSAGTSTPKTFTLVISTPGTLPSGWTLAGINLATGSTASYASGTGQYSIAGASNGDTWGYNDSFQYVYQTLTGDGSIVCQYVSLTNTSSTAKAGIMLRSTLASDSPCAMMCYYPNTTTNFQYRSTSGGLTNVTAGGYGSSVWYKVTRQGNNFSGYVSTNSGSTWTQVGATQPITMGSTIYVGLVNCSVSATASTAVLGNVTIYSTLTRAAIGSTTGDTSTISGSNYTLGAVSNGDIWATTDSFAYLYEPLTGDGTLIGDYASLTNTDPNAKAGFMIRNGTATNAPFAMVCFCPSGGSYFMWRTTAGANVDFFAGGYGTGPLKYKLIRTGNVFSAWVSTNGGTSWSQIGSNQTIVMTGSVQAGLVHCSHSATAGSTTFNNVVLP